MITLSDLLGKGAKILSDNSTTLLTAGGVVGVVGTAVLAGRATLKARDAWVDRVAEHHDKAVEYDLKSDGAGQYPDLTKVDYVKAAWPYFVPAVVVGTATITSIVMANRVSAKQAAALAAAYGLSQNQLEEYKAKVLEKVGVNKEKAIQDAIAQDNVDKHPPQGQVMILGEGLVLFKDSLSGRYFQSTVEKVRRAENSVNAQLFHHQQCSLNFFYDEIDLPTTDLGDGIGWNMFNADHKQLEIRFTTTITDTERPCLVINFNNQPKHNYDQLY